MFPENNSGKQAQENMGNYFMAFPLTNLSFPLTHIFLCNHTEMFFFAQTNAALEIF